MPNPVKTSRQILSLVRQNPGAAAKRIVTINNNAIQKQAALNQLSRANLDLKSVERNIADTYRAYRNEPLDFDPEGYFGYYDFLNDRDQAFSNWKRNFAPVPDVKVFAERSLGYRGPNYPTTHFMGNATMFPYSYGPDYPRQIEIGGRSLEEVPLSKINFKAPLVPRKEGIIMQPQGGYWGPPHFLQQNNTSIDPLDAFDKELRRLDEETYLPFKKGGKIHIKKANRGKFTDYCGGKVTSECIARGKASPNPAIRKRATFAANSRKWAKKHNKGGKFLNWWKREN